MRHDESRLAQVALAAALCIGGVFPASAAVPTERRPPDDARYLPGASLQVAPAAPVVLSAIGEIRTPRWNTSRRERSAQRTAADATEFPENGPCRWLPVSNESPQLAVGVGESRAERDAVRAEVGRLYTFLAADSTINPPIGVCPRFSNAGIEQRLSGGWALPGSALVGYWPAESLSRRGTRIVPDGELSHLEFRVNSLPAASLVNARLRLEDAGGEMWSHVPVTHTIQGFSVLNGSALFVTLHDRPLTRPTAIARLLRWQIGRIDEELPGRRSYAQVQARRLADAEGPDQRARDEAIIARRAQLQYGGDVARARASVAAERETELADLRARADTSRPDNPVHLLTAMRLEADRRLSTLTPAEAAAPGCLTRGVRNAAVPDVVGLDHPQCVDPIDEANPDYWNRSWPRTRMQLIAIGRLPVVPADASPATQAKWHWGNWNLVHGIDWQRFRREVLAGE